MKLPHVLLFSVSIIVCFFLSGCSHFEEINPSKLKEGQKITRIKTPDKKEIDFRKDPLRYGIYWDGFIERFLENGEIRKIPINDAYSIFYEESFPKTDTLIFGILILFLTIVILYMRAIGHISG